MTIQDYIDRLNTRFKTGISREHSYRGDLQNLLEFIAPDVLVTNEPSRVACGAPDYIITKKNIPIGYIEAKDIDADINSKIHKEQFDRYRHSLNNLIITDYLNFQLFRDGLHVMTVSIGEIKGNKIVGKPEHYHDFQAFMKDFCTHMGQTIKSASKLSKMMAGKARLLANVIEKALLPVDTTEYMLNEDGNNTLHEQYRSFKEILIHDINEKTFADIYAQTIAYGMFAARLHDPSLDSFTRQEAAELIPKSNPFLRKLFQYIAGYDLDDRIKWIVDALADIFRATNVYELLKDFGKATQQNDPIIHFYETFLSEYDPALRKSRGVWYTPEPVVNFIVRAVDDILKTEFGLAQGLADTTKTKIKVDLQGKKIDKEVHKVQILDPAAGTGTFLAEVVKHIYKQFEGQQGIWNNYVEEHLIPRLNGFEILMASYAMAHLKLDMLLQETGYRPRKEQRFRIYLTNSLEEHHPDTGTLFASWLSTEANEANHIKRDTPVMVVLGNPPYSVSSSNKGEWIENLVADFKKNLNERNIQPLSDDYIKFIRYGQYLIEKNGEGVLAFITNNSFIDGLIHKQMRVNLLKCFDKIYILDLHGSAKRKEVSKDGSKDENVFDIQTGVSINLFIKNRKKSKQTNAILFKKDIFGKQYNKYEYLQNNTINNIDWENISFLDHLFSFKTYTPSSLSENNSFKINELFNISASGITTERDDLTIQFGKDILYQIVNDISNIPDNEFRIKYNISKDGRDWKLSTAKDDIERNNHELIKILYRPFDNRFTLYSGKSKGFHSYPRSTVMSHLIRKDNLCLVIGRQGQAMGDNEWNIIFISDKVIDCNIFYRGRGTVFTLYNYNSRTIQQTIGQFDERIPNLNLAIVKQISEQLGLIFSPEKNPDGHTCLANSSEVQPEYRQTFAPIDLLDYIYAILHNPTYRAKYKEFLKIDFPRIPYPKDADTFWQLVKLGGELRQIHLLESPVVEKRITTYPETGNNIVDKVRYEAVEQVPPQPFKGSEPLKGFAATTIGKVWINDKQYFDGVPQVAWEFYIGGYQPAQKWLKDRKGRELSFEDIVHYQKIIVALTETDRLMKEVDKVEFE